MYVCIQYQHMNSTLNKYKHLFFDLDRTLWDFEKNCHKTIQLLFHRFQINQLLNTDLNTFYTKYKIVNKKLWDRYRVNKISKNELIWRRFNDTFRTFGYDNPTLAQQFGRAYVEESPLQTALFPYTIELLTYLKTKYQLHIITNGFSEVQYVKIKQCGLNPFFTTVTTSEECGFKKPNPEIFAFSLQKTSAKRDESIMIGDDIDTDIQGAIQYGMDQVFFNPEQHTTDRIATYEVSSLKEIFNLF